MEEANDVDVAPDGGHLECSGQEGNILQEVRLLQWYWIVILLFGCRNRLLG